MHIAERHENTTAENPKPVISLREIQLLTQLLTKHTAVNETILQILLGGKSYLLPTG